VLACGADTPGRSYAKCQAAKITLLAAVNETNILRKAPSALFSN
jgi:hypothetical protein